MNSVDVRTTHDHVIFIFRFVSVQLLYFSRFIQMYEHVKEAPCDVKRKRDKKKLRFMNACVV